MIKDRLEVIFRQSFEIERFTEYLSIDNVPGWDSMAHVGLILALQKEFAISISSADALELTSVKGITQYIQERSAQKDSLR
jgi:acyl carrier protein